MAARDTIDVDGTAVSFLHAGEGPLVVLLNGTFWSRVWEPVLDAAAATGHRVVAPDFPGFGRSGGELLDGDADARALAAWTGRFAAALDAGPIAVVGGHDIGGAVAQRWAVEHGDLGGLVLMDSVLYDSWPVPAVERFRDPAVRAATTPADLREARATSLERGIARPLDPAERDAWLAPWQDPARVRSWMAMAAAADARHTAWIADELERSPVPALLLWGEDDAFQPVRHARRLAEASPAAQLVVVAGARHIPPADAPDEAGEALARFLAERTAHLAP